MISIVSFHRVAMLTYESCLLSEEQKNETINEMKAYP